MGGSQSFFGLLFFRKWWMLCRKHIDKNIEECENLIPTPIPENLFSLWESVFWLWKCLFRLPNFPTFLNGSHLQPRGWWQLFRYNENRGIAFWLSKKNKNSVRSLFSNLTIWRFFWTPPGRKEDIWGTPPKPAMTCLCRGVQLPDIRNLRSDVLKLVWASQMGFLRRNQRRSPEVEGSEPRKLMKGVVWFWWFKVLDLFKHWFFGDGSFSEGVI